MGALDDLIPIRQLLIDGQKVPYAPSLEFQGAVMSTRTDAQNELVTIVGFNVPGYTTAGFDNVLTVTGRRKMTYGGEGDPLILALASSGHTEGGQLLVVIPANTATDLIVAEDMNLAGDTFDPAKTCAIALEVAGGLVYGVLRVIPDADTVAPTLVSATANTADANAVFTTFNKPVYSDGTLPALEFDSGTARTITALESGNGTTELKWTLSGNLAGSEVFDIVFQGGIQSLNGPELEPTSATVDITPEVSFTDTRIFFRGTDVTQSSGIATFVGLDSAVRTVTAPAAGNRPTYTAAEAAFNNQPGGDFVTNDYLQNTSITSINDAAYTVLAVCRWDTPAGAARGTLIELLPTAGATFSGVMIFCESSNIWISRGGVTSSFAYTSTAPVVIKVVVTATYLRLYIDGVLHSEYVAANTIPALTQVRIGAFGAGSYPLDGFLAEVRVIGHALNGTEDADWLNYTTLRYSLP